MDRGSRLLSSVTAFLKYAKHVPQLNRRESFAETIARSEAMDLGMFPHMADTIRAAYDDVRALKVMPSMRKLQFAGDAILKNHARSYNCAFLHLSNPKAFSEALFLLLSGTGVGFSCQWRHVSQLPTVRPPRDSYAFEIPDSIEGWAMALEALVGAFLGGRPLPIFNFDLIREKGSYLVTTGARAPGPDPLRKMLSQVESMLYLAVGRKLTDLEAHDLMCIMSDCVVAGGVRRSAMISLFDRDSQAMLTCKQGEWWKTTPWRARANNSAILHRDHATYGEFMRIYRACRDSRSGEPGIFWTSDYELGTNPCAEIGLNPDQFCNLSSINMTQIQSLGDFSQAARTAAILGTLQAAYTDFHFISPSWKKTTEREALLGISMTGIADVWNTFGFQPSKLMQATGIIADTNREIARKLGINPAARQTCIKPEGTSSCVLMSSSGAHDRHEANYVRNIRISKSEPLHAYLKSVMPGLVNDDQLDPQGAVVSFPIRSPDGAITRDQTSAITLFQRAIHMNNFWIRMGHIEGKNPHNTSITLSVKDDEWDALGEKLWDHRGEYAGISILPYDGGTYTQSPFESVSEETFLHLESMVPELDLTQVREDNDFTSRTETSACEGGLCELKPVR